MENDAFWSQVVRRSHQANEDAAQIHRFYTVRRYFEHWKISLKDQLLDRILRNSRFVARSSSGRKLSLSTWSNRLGGILNMYGMADAFNSRRLKPLMLRRWSGYHQKWLREQQSAILFSDINIKKRYWFRAVNTCWDRKVNRELRQLELADVYRAYRIKRMVVGVLKKAAFDRRENVTSAALRFIRFKCSIVFRFWSKKCRRIWTVQTMEAQALQHHLYNHKMRFFRQWVREKYKSDKVQAIVSYRLQNLAKLVFNVWKDYRLRYIQTSCYLATTWHRKMSLYRTWCAWKKRLTMSLKLHHIEKISLLGVERHFFKGKRKVENKGRRRIFTRFT